MNATLHLENLHYERQARAGSPGFALRVERLCLQAGDVAGVVGPSGCGKSTLIDLLALLRRPAKVSKFALMGHDVATLWSRGGVEACLRLRAAYVGVVLQTGGLLPSLSARENVLLSQRLLGRLDTGWVKRLFSVLDLSGLEERMPAQLSIGQRQRVAIARALAHRPALVLADEPTAALGGAHAGAALDLLLSLAHDSEAALLVVSHDLPLLQSRDVGLLHCVAHGDTVSLERQ